MNSLGYRHVILCFFVNACRVILRSMYEIQLD